MKASLVIPTYRRPHDLSACLDSVIRQTAPPSEVIVVDNGSDTGSEALVRQRESDFVNHGVSLRHIRNDRNSLTAARNLGSSLSSGDVVLFLDDDTIVDQNYIREILNVYETTPKAVGVMGYIPRHRDSRLRNGFFRFFFLSHSVRDGCRVLPSLNTTYPSILGKIMPCQRLSGVSSYRRHVLQEFQFDETLIKYSDGEDVDFSSQVFQGYPGLLFITPFAKYANTTSAEGRAVPRERVYMREVYSLYLFFKLFDTTAKNRLIYLWSRIGWLALALARLLVKQQLGALTELRYTLGAYRLCLRHVREIRRGDLQFFNRTLG